MKPLYWTILIALGVAVGGLILGVAGLLLAPILGVLAIIAIAIWLGERRAQHKPPIE